MVDKMVSNEAVQASVGDNRIFSFEVYEDLV